MCLRLTRISLAGILALLSPGAQAATDVRSIAFSPQTEPAPIAKGRTFETISKGTCLVRLRLMTPRFDRDIIASPGFGIAVYNGSSSAFDFSSANITATSGERSVKIYDPDEYTSELRADYQRDMSMFKNSYISITRESDNLWRGMEWDAFEQLADVRHESSIENSASRKPGGLMSASARSQHARAQRAALARRELNLSERRMLRKTTVQPQQFATGVIRLRSGDVETGKPLILRVKVGGEVHEFSFVVAAN